MANNNTVILVGNMGDEAQVIETEDRTFAAVSLATTDSYKDESGEWQQAATVWHNVLAFNPKVIASLKNLKKGARLELTGSLSYRPRKVTTHDNDGVVKEFDIMEASIIAHKIELAPLVKKQS